MPNRFIILVTVHNSKEWIGKCINSILCQDYKNYKLIIVDDHSDDGTWEIVSKYEGLLIRNEKRLFHSLISMINAIKGFVEDDEDIIVSVDGDDWLIDEQVLSVLNEAYDGEIWLTYGQYIPYSDSYKNYCQPLGYNRTTNDQGEWIESRLDSRTYRHSGVWITSHLKTFKKKLWDKIDDKDFREENGEYFKTCGDCAMLYPMIEMAGDQHIKFINRVLYVYNDLNPNCHTRTIPDESIRIARYLRSKPCYDAID